MHSLTQRLLVPRYLRDCIEALNYVNDGRGPAKQKPAEAFNVRYEYLSMRHSSSLYVRYQFIYADTKMLYKSILCLCARWMLL